jgi:hypothetical protein
LHGTRPRVPVPGVSRRDKKTNQSQETSFGCIISLRLSVRMKQRRQDASGVVPHPQTSTLTRLRLSEDEAPSCSTRLYPRVVAFREAGRNLPDASRSSEVRNSILVRTNLETAPHHIGLEHLKLTLWNPKGCTSCPRGRVSREGSVRRGKQGSAFSPARGTKRQALDRSFSDPIDISVYTGLAEGSVDAEP